MTFAPASLRTLGSYIGSQGVVNLGIVGDTDHQFKGTSYHLGEDMLLGTAYSRQHPRDKAGLSDAASAIDMGRVEGSFVGLRKLSVWLVGQCQAKAPGTLDIREVIYSEDGKAVRHWDAPTGTIYPGGTGSGHGDDSHLTHTHISYFRDSEDRDKVALFRRYFEEDEVIGAIKGEDWTPTVTNGQSNGVYRAAPDRAAAIVARLPAGTIVRTIAEVAANGENWRLSELNGAPAYFLRGDLDPLVPGGDPAVDKALTDYITRVPPAVADCAPAVAAATLAGRRQEWDRQNANAKVALAPKP